MCFSCDTQLEECRDCNYLFCLDCDIILNKEITDKLKPSVGFYEFYNLDNDEYLDLAKQLYLIHTCGKNCDWLFHNCKNCRLKCGCNNCLKIDSDYTNSDDSSIDNNK